MEFQKICLDTNILIDVLRKKTKVIEKIQVLEMNSALLATTVINSFELYYGAYKSNRPKNIDYVNELLENLFILNWPSTFSEKAGKIFADLDQKGQKLDYRDLFIGTITRENDFILLTRNVNHFKRIPNLKLQEF